jgi:hypothetical protein
MLYCSSPGTGKPPELRTSSVAQGTTGTGTSFPPSHFFFFKSTLQSLHSAVTFVPTAVPGECGVPDPHRFCLKRPINCHLNWAFLLCDVAHDGKTKYTAQFWQAIAQVSELSLPVVFNT